MENISEDCIILKKSNNTDEFINCIIKFYEIHNDLVYRLSVAESKIITLKDELKLNNLTKSTTIKSSSPTTSPTSNNRRKRKTDDPLVFYDKTDDNDDRNVNKSTDNLITDKLESKTFSVQLSPKQTKDFKSPLKDFNVNEKFSEDQQLYYTNKNETATDAVILEKSATESEIPCSQDKGIVSRYKENIISFNGQNKKNKWKSKNKIINVIESSKANAMTSDLTGISPLKRRPQLNLSLKKTIKIEPVVPKTDDSTTDIDETFCADIQITPNKSLRQTSLQHYLGKPSQRKTNDTDVDKKLETDVQKEKNVFSKTQPQNEKNKSNEFSVFEISNDTDEIINLDTLPTPEITLNEIITKQDDSASIFTDSEELQIKLPIRQKTKQQPVVQNVKQSEIDCTECRGYKSYMSRKCHVTDSTKLNQFKCPIHTRWSRLESTPDGFWNPEFPPTQDENDKETLIDYRFVKNK